MINGVPGELNVHHNPYQTACPMKFSFLFISSELKLFGFLNMSLKISAKPF